MENFLIPGVVDNQTLAYPVPADSAIAWISMEDAAAYGVYALNHPELAGETLPIVGPEALTGNQLAEQFSAALDREIQFFFSPSGSVRRSDKSSTGQGNGKASPTRTNGLD